MNARLARLITRVVIFSTPVVWGAWDVFVEVTFGHKTTESRWFWVTALYHPWFPVAFGAFEAFMWWHFFWGFWQGPTPQNLAK